jgi:hypothetical protein
LGGSGRHSFTHASSTAMQRFVLNLSGPERMGNEAAVASFLL